MIIFFIHYQSEHTLCSNALNTEFLMDFETFFSRICASILSTVLRASLVPCLCGVQVHFRWGKELWDCNWQFSYNKLLLFSKWVFWNVMLGVIVHLTSEILILLLTASVFAKLYFTYLIWLMMKTIVKNCMQFYNLVFVWKTKYPRSIIIDAFRLGTMINSDQLRHYHHSFVIVGSLDVERTV